ncbi:hypothetical protein BKA66DRAFT_593705 [Pyrenochaeta sp. MPI-SDFR-AT-0127]|nr:hypothetical protein BKA66DRAFT_593705 [Pyrenochaeta sp. MPI-SDFR-AT-0127]
MAKAIRNALQAMEDLNNVFLLPAQAFDSTQQRLHQRQQQKLEEFELTPPHPIVRKRRLTLPLNIPEDPPHRPRARSSATTPALLKFASTSSSSHGLAHKTSSNQQPQPSLQKTFDQSQSPLIKLPPELRILIYQFVICGGERGRVDITWCKVKEGGRRPLLLLQLQPRVYASSMGTSRGDLRSEVRPERRLADRGNDAVQEGKEHWRRMFLGKEGKEGGMGVFGLLACCRVIYSEFIPFLYSTPTFHFHINSATTFVAFMGSLLPQRRNQIKHLKFNYWRGIQPRDPFYLDTKVSYTDVREAQIRSPLPDASVRKKEMIAAGWVGGKVPEHWVVSEILKGMEGLRNGSVVGWPSMGPEDGL